MPKVDDFDDETNDPTIAKFRSKLRDIENGNDEDEDDGPSERDDDVPEITTEEDDRGQEVHVVPLTRQEKKRERMRLREEAEALRRENSEVKERLARLEGAMSANQRRTDVRDETDDVDDVEREIDQQLEEIQNQHTAAWNALKAKGANVTEADKAEYQKTVKELDKRKVKVAARAMIRGEMAAVQQGTQQEVVRAQIRQRHADVYENPRAVQFAEGEYRKLIALGKPESMETLDASMAEARKAFRINGREPPPSDAQRAKYTGAPRGRSAPSGKEPESIRMTPELRRIADSAYSHISDPAKRYQMWAQGPGREMMKNMKQDRG